MSYDLNLVQQLCREIGLPARIIDVHYLGVDLGEGAVLCFQNAESEADCLIGFPAEVRGTYAWHLHDPIQFGDHRGYIELCYLDLVVALKEGRVLVCERQMDVGSLNGGWLTTNTSISNSFRKVSGSSSVARRPMLAAPRIEGSSAALDCGINTPGGDGLRRGRGRDNRNGKAIVSNASESVSARCSFLRTNSERRNTLNDEAIE